MNVSNKFIWMLYGIGAAGVLVVLGLLVGFWLVLKKGNTPHPIWVLFFAVAFAATTHLSIGKFVTGATGPPQAFGTLSFLILTVVLGSAFFYSTRVFARQSSGRVLWIGCILLLLTNLIGLHTWIWDIVGQDGRYNRPLLKGYFLETFFGRPRR